MTGIYARVSTEEQAKKGYSISDQIRECRKLSVTVKGTVRGTVREYIDDGISGEFLDRPGLSRLRQDVREGLITRIICLNPDRLSRKLMNQLIISEEFEKKARLVFVDGEYKNTPEGKLFYQMRGAISEFEKAKINERMSRGRREKARQGKIVKDYGVFGYDYDYQKCNFNINDYEAETVKLIFRLFTGKNKKVQGINGIARYLTDNEVPTKKRVGVWHRQVVRQILMNRAYIGEFYQNKWNTEGMLANKYKNADEYVPIRKRPKKDWILVTCPAIINKEEFLYAQKLLQESRRRWTNKSRHKYLLSGLVRCGKCENTMTGMCKNNWGKKIFVYSDEKNTSGAKKRGCKRTIRANILEENVWNSVFDWLCMQEVKRDNEDDEDNAIFQQKELGMVHEKLIEIKKGRQNLIGILAGGDNEIGENAVKEIKVKLSELDIKEKKYRKKKNDLETYIKNVSKNFKKNLLSEAVNYYLKVSPEEIDYNDKKYLIRTLVKEIKVYDDEIKIFGF